MKTKTLTAANGIKLFFVESNSALRCYRFNENEKLWELIKKQEQENR